MKALFISHPLSKAITAAGSSSIYTPKQQIACTAE
jgi:hypothetical protein